LRQTPESRSSTSICCDPAPTISFPIHPHPKYTTQTKTQPARMNPNTQRDVIEFQCHYSGCEDSVWPSRTLRNQHIAKQHRTTAKDFQCPHASGSDCERSGQVWVHVWDMSKHLESIHGAVDPPVYCPHPGCRNSDRMDETELRVHGQANHALASASGAFVCPVRGCRKSSRAESFRDWGRYVQHLELMHQTRDALILRTEEGEAGTWLNIDPQLRPVEQVDASGIHTHHCFYPMCRSSDWDTLEELTRHGLAHANAEEMYPCPWQRCPKSTSKAPYRYFGWLMTHLRTKHMHDQLPELQSDDPRIELSRGQTSNELLNPTAERPDSSGARPDEEANTGQNVRDAEAVNSWDGTWYCWYPLCPEHTWMHEKSLKQHVFAKHANIHWRFKCPWTKCRWAEGEGFQRYNQFMNHLESEHPATGWTEEHQNWYLQEVTGRSGESEAQHPPTSSAAQQLAGPVSGNVLPRISQQAVASSRRDTRSSSEVERPRKKGTKGKEPQL